MLKDLRLKPEKKESVYSQSYIARERELVKKMIETAKRRNGYQEPSPHSKKLEEKRKTMAYAENLFSKRFGLTAKGGEQGCFMSMTLSRTEPSIDSTESY